MKKLTLILAALILSGFVFAQNNLPFTKGINMLRFFETWNKGDLPNLYKHDEADFACLKSMGVEAIRLTVHFELLMEPYNTGTIYDFVLEKLDQVCDWAEKYQIYLIIDNHAFNSEAEDNNPPTAKMYKEHLEAVWSQIAERYKDRSEYIIYEIINEPKGRGDISAKWYTIQQEIIDLIRTYDTKHAIVVSGADWSSPDTLVKMKPYKDPNLIYTFHFYEPMLFTHQGATWVGQGMANTSDIPFPYEKARMPKLNKEAASDGWVQSMYNEYYNIGTAKYINQRIKKAADWGKKNKVRILCGEIGAKVWTNPVDRLAWINATRTALETNKIPYCCWGLDGSDGFLKSDAGSMIFPDDIDKDALEAYGFKMPDPKLAEKASITITSQKPYLVYDGILGAGVGKGYWGNVKEIKKDASSDYCMLASYPGQQNGWIFWLPGKVTSIIAEAPQSFIVSFAIKFTDVKQEFRFHLSDADEGEALPPWKNSVTIRAADYSVGKWISVEIPFSRLSESGAWSNKANKWFPPQGKFDWSRLDSIHLDFDDFDNKNIGDIYIDDILIKKK